LINHVQARAFLHQILNNFVGARVCGAVHRRGAPFIGGVGIGSKLDFCPFSEIVVAGPSSEFTVPSTLGGPIALEASQLHHSREVAEAEVDDLDVLLLYQPNDVARGALLHASTSI